MPRRSEPTKNRHGRKLRKKLTLSLSLAIPDQLVATHQPEAPAVRRLPAGVERDAVAVTVARRLAGRVHGFEPVMPRRKRAFELALLLREAFPGRQVTVPAAVARRLAARRRRFVYAHVRYGAMNPATPTGA